MRRSQNTSEPVHLGFQIAPMIDVVFVIMLFFMVMAASVKTEKVLGLILPSGVLPGLEVKLPASEMEITVADDESVALNDELMATAADRGIARLDQAIQGLGLQSHALDDNLLVTINTEPQARYGRIIDVLNSLAKAKITRVTFAVAAEE